MKRQPTKWKKIFVNRISEKGLISKIYLKKKTPHNSVTKKPNNPTLKMGRHFFRKDIRWPTDTWKDVQHY